MTSARSHLADNGYDVAGVADGEAMKRHLACQPVDLVLLDVMLPGEDGLSLARTLSAQGGPAIIMLSARGQEVDRIVGLEVGADDYLPKPFNPRELLARIHAVLRRRPAPEAPGCGVATRRPRAGAGCAASAPTPSTSCRTG